uniref:Endo-1,4-beta-xylanase B n=1 Tax=uncultured Armatimonadetes bacterium TaxID=157466 RepID=A0A6J4K9D8_9BACT|nr:Endo-1,4-beta-xylanase B precursor [uncultured Armatimonadetes bacterium]
MAEKTLLLWPNGAPGALGTEDRDVPSLTVFEPAPDKANGAAVVVCPGGGYGGLADHEGAPVARWLSTLGVTGFVLRYRLGPRYRHPVMLGDAARAIRLVRTRAAGWKLDPARVGILGFSAGGHLASTAATHFDHGKPDAPDPIDQHSSRPNVAILIYPVISLLHPYAHVGSRENLLGKDAPDDLVRSLSNETQVTAQTPPTFLIHTAEDKGVPAENSLLFALALRKAGVPLEMHLYERGPHGFGLAEKDPVLGDWPARCAAWLNVRGFLTKGA